MHNFPKSAVKVPAINLQTLTLMAVIRTVSKFFWQYKNHGLEAFFAALSFFSVQICWNFPNEGCHLKFSIVWRQQIWGQSALFNVSSMLILFLLPHFWIWSEKKSHQTGTMILFLFFILRSFWHFGAIWEDSVKLWRILCCNIRQLD